MQKFKSLWQKNGRKFMSVFCAVLMFCMMCVTAFAAEGTSDVVSPESAATQVFEMLKTQINMTTILSVLGVALLAALGLVLGWWAIRKVTRMLFSAFKKGKASV